MNLPHSSGGAAAASGVNVYLGTAGRRPAHSPDGVSVLGSAWRDERYIRRDGGRVAPGRGADGQTQCLAASGRAQFATPSGLAICERHGVAWPKAARRAVPLRGSRGTKRCGRFQGGPWTSPERFHTERSNNDVHCPLDYFGGQGDRVAVCLQ